MQRRVFNKLKSKKGETLVGILVAVLIIALSAGMFAAMYSAAGNINLSARRRDEKFFESVENLEKNIESGGDDNNPGTDGTLTYIPTGDDWDKAGGDNSSFSVDVEVFTEDGMTTYRKSGAAGGGAGS